MSEFNVGDKVYLECEVRNKDMSDNKYTLKYINWRGDEYISTDVKDDVLHPTDESYNKGLNDAWELAKKIVVNPTNGGYTANELVEIFGMGIVNNPILDAYTPQEAIAKVKAYEECNEIKKGDVVRLKGCCVEGIVTKVTEANIYRLFKDGSSTKEAFKDVEGFAKTGKHFDSIDEFMRSEK